MTRPHPTWTMHRFSGKGGTPVYIVLTDVAAITAASLPEDQLTDGARVVLFSGVALYVRESCDAVFEEVLRARTVPEPKPDPIRNYAPDDMQQFSA